MKDLRQRLDEIDRLLTPLLAMRMHVSTEIGEEKKKTGKPIFDPQREEEILSGISAIVAENQLPLTRDTFFSICRVYEEIMGQSRKLQSKTLLPQTICLIGYMGSGKSSVGEALARFTGYDYLDMDTRLIKAEHLSVNEIFNQLGEPYFREKEESLLQEVTAQNGLIVSCGGGIILSEKNRTLLKESGGTVFLDGDPAVMLQRIKEDPSRPNSYFETENQEQRLLQFSNLYEKRKDLYLAAASYCVFVHGETPDQLAARITGLLTSASL